MRNKIDYGIDLGTTNSAIARMEAGVPVIKKTDTLKDTLPSCVHFNKKKGILVGDQAFNIMKVDNAKALKTLKQGQTNTFIEFKRTMGTTHTYESSNMDRSFSSEELSAEVVKKLKSLITDENISSIVITVPAKFLNPQNEATKTAARLAGFEYVELLQEPVAAATAYGLTAENKDSYWLVFDFGGGTFDAALIKAEEGILTVKDTDGDNWLGGKNLDDAIVDHIILPYLQENYAIDGMLGNSVQRELLRATLKTFAEQVKIQLSFNEEYDLLSELGDLPFSDENGEELEIDIHITQADMERVCGPIFQKAIDISKELLKRNNLKGSDLGSVILVGGPTYSPVLRKMINNQITDKVDASVDPMTVVARGAALFASTIKIPDNIIDEKRDQTKIQLEVNFEATSVEDTELGNITILKDKTIGTIPNEVFAEIVRGDSAWSSAKTLISANKKTLIEVFLHDGVNSFEVKLYDDSGNKLDSEGGNFTIIQGIGGVGEMTTLPYHIGIGKFFDTEEKELFIPAKGLEKTKKLPAIGVINGLKTRQPIRPGIASDTIRIPIYQGAYNAEGTNPLLNNLIEEVIISGESLPELLPIGSDVDITIKVDRSQIMQFSAYFPILDYTEELKIEVKQTEVPSEQELAERLAEAKSEAHAVDATHISKQIDALEAQLEHEKGSADGRMKILNSLRKELLKLEKASQKAEWPQVEQELKDVFYELEDLVQKVKMHDAETNLNIDKVDSYLEVFRGKVDLVIQEKDIKTAKKLTAEIRSMDFQVRSAATNNAMDVGFLQHLNDTFDSVQWKDANKARQLINQGLRLAAEGQTLAIRPILVEVINLMDRGGSLMEDDLLG